MITLAGTPEPISLAWKGTVNGKDTSISVALVDGVFVHFCVFRSTMTGLEILAAGMYTAVGPEDSEGMVNVEYTILWRTFPSDEVNEYADLISSGLAFFAQAHPQIITVLGPGD